MRSKKRASEIMTREYVKVGNIIKPKREGEKNLPAYERKNFPSESLLHNAQGREDAVSGDARGLKAEVTSAVFDTGKTHVGHRDIL